MSFITNNLIKSKALWSLYDSCSSDEQKLIRIMALIYEPVYQKTINQLVHAVLNMTVLSLGNNSLKLEKQLRTKLINMGLLTESPTGIRLSIELYHPLMMSWVTDVNARIDLKSMINLVRRFVPIVSHTHGEATDWQNERAFRYQAYLGQFVNCEAMLSLKQPPHPINLEPNLTLVNLCFYPFDQAFFATLPVTVQYQAFADLFAHLRLTFKDNIEVIALLQSLIDEDDGLYNMRALLAEQYLLMDDLANAQKCLAGLDETPYVLGLSGWLTFMQGDSDGAIECFELCKKAKNRVQRRKRQYVGGMAGLFYVMALLQSSYNNQPDLFAQIEEESDAYTRADGEQFSPDIAGFAALKMAADHLNGKSDRLFQYEFFKSQYDEHYYLQLSALISALCFYWAELELPDGYHNRLMSFFDKALAANNLWYAKTAAQLLQTDVFGYQPSEKFLLHHKTQGISLVDLIEKKSEWDNALDVLIAMKQETKYQQKAQVTHKQSRLIWVLHDVGSVPYLEAKEQKMGKKGWSKGRAVALKRLSGQLVDFDFVSEHDKRLIKAIDKESGYGYFAKDSFELSGFDALQGCVNHPNIYLLGQLEQPIDVVEREPELVISTSSKGYILQMPGATEAIRNHHTYYTFGHETGQRYRLVFFSSQHQRIAAVMGQNGLNVPIEAKQKVLDSISAVAPLLNIQSDIAGIGDTDSGLKQVEPDKTLYIDIQPAGPGLQFECHVQPLGEHGPMLKPGSGSPTMVAQVGGEQCAVSRDLSVEKSHMAQLIALLIPLCPVFDALDSQPLVLDDLEVALSVLEILQAMHNNSLELKENSLELEKNSLETPVIALQWPKGKAIKLTKTAKQQQMQLSLGKQKDWFSLEGELNIADDELIDLQKLLLLLDSSPGRFIALSNDKFLVLTEQLRHQLDLISTATTKGKFHSLAVPLVDEAVAGMKVKTNRAWQQQIKRLKESFSMDVQLPTTLQANLRDYQKDGYDWASRLAHWGGGACLADDMGLGKTLQALLMIVSRAAKGPSLVLAPTSVCFNWQEEALRFAPTLSVKLYGEGSKKTRQAMLDNAEPFDLIVCSYGLLQSSGKQLFEVKWHTLVADEAQAIKNPQAKRTKLAMALNADFKMITTGTPIENNLTELWSLFSFINPGLLGSQKDFTQRFATIIENADEDPTVRKNTATALRKLISPFILRRLKSEVLTELPSRTEINLHVELSDEEVVFYEALRQKAVETMLASDDRPGQKRIKILAEIMRLRRACCHPSLVLENCDIPGSKLKVFGNLVDELKQGNHKALVFSQFIGHLDILREHLTQKGISFQYLDGSTTPANRKKAVQAFQAGEGDLFLISLKAGGSGLNLTAADYVIHMDPWWNPAVEDQASDRAHRMGQTRPVTIYRLISQNTIEDKIVALHQQKRDLANSLLEGTQSGGNLNFDDMMNLLKGG